MQFRPYILILSFYLFLLSVNASAQVSDSLSNVNPFELTHRIKSNSNVAVVSDSLPIQNIVPVEIKQFEGNPFEVVKVDHSKVYVAPSNGSQSSFGQNIVSNVTPLFLRMKGNSVFIYGVMLAVLLLISAVMLMNRHYFSQLFQSFRNDNLMRVWHRETSGNLVNPYFLILYLCSISTISLLIYHWFKNSYFPEIGVMAYLFILGFMLAMTLLKQFILIIIASIFPVEKEISIYRFMINIFNVVLGLVLLPSVDIQLVAESNIAKFAFGISILLVCAVIMYRLLRSFLIGMKYFSVHTFHFFLYLCTIEIVPVLIILKFCPFIYPL